MSEQPALTCTNCGRNFTPRDGYARESLFVLVEEESRRCARLREITQQRQALVAKMQAGIVGMLGRDSIDTNDVVAQRESLAQLEAALKAEAGELARVMGHTPAGPDRPSEPRT